MKLKNIDPNIQRSGGIISDEFVEELLCKFGSEGLYELSEKIIKAADKDVSDALNELNKVKFICDLYTTDLTQCNKLKLNDDSVCNGMVLLRVCNYQIKNNKT